MPHVIFTCGCLSSLDPLPPNHCGFHVQYFDIMAPNPSAYSQRVKLFASLLLLFSRTEALAFSVVDQCPNRPVGELGSRLSTCPLPGHLGITPEIESTITQWSSPPHCIATPIENSTEPQIDCLFSATTFRNGHGISLVTSTIHASDLVGAESFVDYPVPLSVQKREGRGPSYQIRDVPGKGKGIVATRRIRRGEIILIDVPAVLMSIAFLANTKPHHRRRLIKQAIGRLPDETQREIYALSRGKERHEMDAILGTNTNTVGLADGYPHVGLFLKLAVRGLQRHTNRLMLIQADVHSASTTRVVQSKTSMWFRPQQAELTMTVLTFASRRVV